MAARPTRRLRTLAGLFAAVGLLAGAGVESAAAAGTPVGAATAGSAYPDPQCVTGDTTPVHDPSMVRLADGEYVLYSTHDGIAARTSWDRVHWRDAGAAFPTTPAWWTRYSATSDPWAPDVSFHGGRYWLYYAVSSFGSNDSAIGLATSRTGLPGSWTDDGIVFATTTADRYNAIDPSLTVDRRTGAWYLTFGSYWSDIWQFRVDPRTGKPDSAAPKLTQLAFRSDAPQAIEGAYLLQHGGYFYLFASYDACCAGVDSTYNIRVGRSTSPDGPFTDEEGRPMLDGGGTLLLAGHGRYVGTGGESVLDDRGQDVLVYHYYDGDNAGTPTLGLNALGWAHGWPVVVPTEPPPARG